MRKNLFWLSDEQWERIEPRLPTDVRGVERADDRRLTVGQSVRRIATIARIAGEQRSVAEIFASIAAIGANPTGRSKPGHADPLAAREASDIRPQARDAADDFVSRHDGELKMRQLAVDDMQIGAADPACFDFDQDFAGSRLRNWALPQH